LKSERGALPRFVVAEPGAPIANVLRRFLGSVAEVAVVSDEDEVVARVVDQRPGVLVAAVAAGFDGEGLVARVRRDAPDTSIVLLYDAGMEAVAVEQALQVDADGFLVAPLKRQVVLSVMRLAQRLHSSRVRLREKAAAALGEAPKRANLGRAAPNTPDEAFFKKYLLLEIKRSRRYRYPVGLLVIALDTPGTKSRRDALQVVGAALRDIDLAFPFATDRILAFLPYTKGKGILDVSKRILGRFEASDLGTASIGVAVFDPEGKPKLSVSYGGLVRLASAALKRAKEAGGNRVEIEASGE
jgi:PleD family two-component response regulator